MSTSQAAIVGALALLLAGTAPLFADEKPLVAGSDGVPIPKKTRHVQPVYPADAAARGIRGVVILELVIDATGHVASASVVRSVPGLDAAATAAARQWQYEPAKVDGKPVSVSLTVPITFSLPLPELVRAGGIPELRQGATPVYPAAARGNGNAVVEVTLEADGGVGTTQVLSGVEPWTSALVAALKSWRFSPPEGEAVVSFRVEAAFIAAGAPGAGKVSLTANGLRQTDLLTAAQPAATPTGAATSAPPSGPAAAPAAASPAPSAADTRASTEPPPIEVLTAPPPPLPPENGVSAVRDVTLEAGVPELARGRRPVTPPFARMAHSGGEVEVAFSVGAAGTTLVQRVTGPELLKKEAEEAVGSWVFRRTRADRAYLTALFTYAGDKATAVVRPQPAPAAATPASEPAAAAPPASLPKAEPATAPGAPGPPPSSTPPV